MDCKGNTGLHLASLKGHADIMGLLLASESFTGICVQNTQGRTALHCAAEQGDRKAAEMLLHHRHFNDKAVNAVAEEDVLSGLRDFPFKGQCSEAGLTALHVTAKFGLAGVAELLLEDHRFSAADASTMKHGMSALHIAATYGHYTVCKALLHGGARRERKRAMKSFLPWTWVRGLELPRRWRGSTSNSHSRSAGKIRVFLNPWFGEPVVCTLDSRGFRHFRGFRDFCESSTQLLVCSCLSCLRHFCRFRDFCRFRERRPAPKP